MAKASRERPAPRAMAGTGQEPATITVRRARPSDLSHVVRLRLALLHEHGEHPVYSRLRKDAEKRAHEMFASQLVSPGEVIFLAERDGEVVGILRCVESLASPLLEPPRYGYVSSVYVTPEARRHGVRRWRRMLGSPLLRRAALGGGWQGLWPTATPPLSLDPSPPAAR